jgi:hypothetical protein
VKFADAAYLLLPAAHLGEMNLTSMNGERRMRLAVISYSNIVVLLSGANARTMHIKTVTAQAA